MCLPGFTDLPMPSRLTLLLLLPSPAVREPALLMLRVNRADCTDGVSTGLLQEAGISASRAA